MDIERGNIEILFWKINYLAIGRQINFEKSIALSTHTYKNIDKNLYIRCSEKVFSYMMGNERENAYLLACKQMKDAQGNNPSVFRLLTEMSKNLLRLDGDEIRCKFDKIFRWRELSFPLGQDIFTCAYLTDYDLNRGFETKCFTWLPIIRSDNDRLNNILKKGVAENHFHLAGSTKIFELNWISLMNQIDGRLHDFKKMKRTLQEYSINFFDILEKRESFYAECQRAALYRIYLFAVVKKDEFLSKKLQVLLCELQKGVKLEEILAEIQNTIVLAEKIYGARLNGSILDYTLEKSMINENVGQCRLLAGERKFLYDCFRYVTLDLFTEEQKDLFYAYLVIRTDFRGEIIQTNGQVGFDNFLNYQNRKEYFIEGKRPYEDKLVRLALNESLRKKNIVSLEARICPKNTSAKLFQVLRNYEKIVKEGVGEEAYGKLIYVLHFPKIFELPFVWGVPRNDNARRMCIRQTRSIVALLEKRMSINEHIRGIDACSSEIACRPEVFGQVFRYLSDTVVMRNETQENRTQENKTITRYKTRNLHTTYHVGEDFFDIADGLRAIDEAILFCGLKRGSRLGHALALGINPEEYYKFKGYKIVLSKQILLDDIVWVLCKAEELDCGIDSSLKKGLEEKYCDLYEEIFRDNLGKDLSMSVYEYYQSWKLRGDRPEIYKLSKAEFLRKITRTELERFDRYQFNNNISNDLRKNDRYRDLYYAYHFNKKVRLKGGEITEFKVEQSYIKFMWQLQNGMIHQLVDKGIGIETNPSSNYLIGTIKRYEEHPILRFNARKLRTVEPNTSLSVSINTDDQGVFDTLLENEYALMTLALKKAKDKDTNLIWC